MTVRAHRRPARDRLDQARQLHGAAPAGRRAPPLRRLRPPGRLAAPAGGDERARHRDPGHRHRRPRLLHHDRQRLRHRVHPVPARPRPGGGDRHQAGAARGGRVHAPGRRRHGQRGPARDPARRRPGREDHLLHAQQRRVRRHRRPDDGAPRSSGSAPRPASRAATPSCTAIPIPVANLLAQLPGVAYVARGRGQQRRRRSPRPRSSSGGPSSPSWPAPGSASSRCSPCARRAGSCRRPRGPSYLAGTIEETFPVGQLKAPARHRDDREA